MSEAYTVPGVYITESNGLALSIQSGETAVPVFVGVFNRLDPVPAPAFEVKSGSGPICERIESWLDFSSKFTSSDRIHDISQDKGDEITDYKGSYSVRLYFENGGGPCYVLYFASRDDLDDKAHQALIAPTIAQYPDITLLCWCEIIKQSQDDEIYSALSPLLGASATSGGNQGRFLLADAFVDGTEENAKSPSSWTNFTTPTVSDATQVATYFPALKTNYTRDYSDAVVGGFTEDQYGLLVDGKLFKTGGRNNDPTARARWSEVPAAAQIGLAARQAKASATPGESTTAAVNKANEIITEFNNFAKRLANADKQPVYLRASVAMAGVYARVDRERGVWKAPANVALSGVAGLVAAGRDPNNSNVKWKEVVELNVDDSLNEKLVNSKINAIRTFRGQGTMVWGARTMEEAGKNDWRYVPVRRLFNAVERDARAALRQALFEPNTPVTWSAVRSALESYLYGLWKKGALQGETPEQAFSVQIGLGITMTPEDITNGNLKVRVSLAAVRPAEFIVLELSQQVGAG